MKLIFLKVCLIILATRLPAYAVDLPSETYYQADAILNGGDVHLKSQPIGFSFSFFGNNYTEFHISTKGMLMFTEPNHIWTNQSIPNNNLPNNFIAPFWDDISAETSNHDSTVYYKTIGTAPNRKMVVQWTNVYFWATKIPVGTFQAILYEASNEIQLQYRYITTSNSMGLGSSATVGIENADGSAGVQYSYNTKSLSSGKVIRFIPNGATYTIKNDADYDSILLGGSTIEANINNHINNKGNTIKDAKIEADTLVDGGTILILKIDTISFAAMPIKVRHVKTKTRASTDQSIRLGIGQTVYFTTEDGMEIMANPAVQDIKQLKLALAKLNLPTFKITEEGNIKVPATETTWYSGRADLASTKIDTDIVNGFITKENGNLALIFEDENGQKLEQILYPSPVNLSALEKMELNPKGILEIEINGQKIKGRLDYTVKQTTTTQTEIKLTEIPDSNGDFMITYPDGAEQRLFGLPE